MVWYNITAYNLKVKFVLRNNKEKVICNNKNAEGVMQMKCKRNLERAIVLGLILSTGVCGSAWAADIEFHGKVDTDGNTFVNEDNVKWNENINGININVAGSEKTYDTTAALIFKTGKKHTVTGDVYIVNTVDAPDGEDSSLNISNNDGLQVIDGSKVDIQGNDVYIASVGGSGYKSASFQGMNLTARKKSTALSVGIGDNNEISIKGDNVKIIGNIDFTSDDTNALKNRKKNKVILELKSQNSYFYGDVYDRVMAKAEVPNSPSSITISGLVDDRQGTAIIKLSNSAEWIYDEIPQIEYLNLDGGIVVLDDEYIQSKYENEIIKVYDENGKVIDEVKLSDDRKANHNIVKVDNLCGSGIFKADINWLNNKGDKYTYNQYYENKNLGDYMDELADHYVLEDKKFNPGTDYIFITSSKKKHNSNN